MYSHGRLKTQRLWEDGPTSPYLNIYSSSTGDAVLTSNGQVDKAFWRIAYLHRTLSPNQCLACRRQNVSFQVVQLLCTKPRGKIFMFLCRTCNCGAAKVVTKTDKLYFNISELFKNKRGKKKFQAYEDRPDRPAAAPQPTPPAPPPPLPALREFLDRLNRPGIVTAPTPFREEIF